MQFLLNKTCLLKLVCFVSLMWGAFTVKAQHPIIDSAWQPIFRDTCYASYYHNKFHNRRTSNGDIYKKNQLTAAHRTLPFGTLLKVTDPRTKKWVIVRINDRGPFNRKRNIDLSYRAAKHLGMVNSRGVIKVYLEEIPYMSKESK